MDRYFTILWGAEQEVAIIIIRLMIALVEGWTLKTVVANK